MSVHPASKSIHHNYFSLGKKISARTSDFMRSVSPRPVSILQLSEILQSKISFSEKSDNLQWIEGRIQARGIVDPILENIEPMSWYHIDNQLSQKSASEVFRNRYIAIALSRYATASNSSDFFPENYFEVFGSVNSHASAKNYLDHIAVAQGFSSLQAMIMSSRTDHTEKLRRFLTLLLTPEDQPHRITA